MYPFYVISECLYVKYILYILCFIYSLFSYLKKLNEETMQNDAENPICSQLAVMDSQSPQPSILSNLDKSVQQGESSGRQISSPDYVSDTSLSSSNYKSEVGVPKKFSVPDSWRSEIMVCIKDKKITPKARSALVRDLVVHMYSFSLRPSRQFCEFAARRLITKYPFLRDAVGTVM